MIFCGDISVPFQDGVIISGIPLSEKNKIWIGNLEGSLVDEAERDINILLQKRIVFNSLSGICSLQKIIPFKVWGMANNHLLDACSVKESKHNLSKIVNKQFGAGENIDEAMLPFLLTDDGIDYAIFAFGSRSIKCKDAKKNSEGSNPWNKWHVLSVMKAALKDYPNRRLVAFFHWNTELELYPQPLHRELSHQLIDLGVYAIIGCHAHRVQPIEIYKGHPIVYGLGNFAFRQNTYMNGKLKFPSFSYPEIAFEICGGDFIIHNILYHVDSHVVEYLNKVKISESNAPFAELDYESYKKWFRKNRFQKKGIPISYYEDSHFVSECKYLYSKTRGSIIDLLVKNELLFKFFKALASKIYK